MLGPHCLCHFLITMEKAWLSPQQRPHPRQRLNWGHTQGATVGAWSPQPYMLVWQRRAVCKTELTDNSRVGEGPGCGLIGTQFCVATEQRARMCISSSCVEVQIPYRGGTETPFPWGEFLLSRATTVASRRHVTSCSPRSFRQSWFSLIWEATFREKRLSSQHFLLPLE